MSANLPIGIRKTAKAKTNELTVQPNMIALMDNSLPIEGNAIFTAVVRDAEN